MSAQKKEKLSPTKRKLQQMLKTSTGASMLDSGGAYGRHWEKNQKRDFENEPAMLLSFDIYQPEGKPAQLEIELSFNVYHWLAAKLTFDPIMNAIYQRFAKPRREKREYEMSIMEEFTDRKSGMAAKGVYGEGEPFTVNTYNGEDAVSQTLQYRYFNYAGDAYVLLQIHQGCDVRGGYTDAVAFKVDDDTSIMDNARGDLWDGKDHSWHSDNAGYSWYANDSSYEDLKNYLVTTDRDFWVRSMQSGEEQYIYVDTEKKEAWSPWGGKLEGGFG